MHAQFTRNAVSYKENATEIEYNTNGNNKNGNNTYNDKHVVAQIDKHVHAQNDKIDPLESMHDASLLIYYSDKTHAIRCAEALLLLHQVDVRSMFNGLNLFYTRDYEWYGSYSPFDECDASTTCMTTDDESSDGSSDRYLGDNEGFASP
tara:strand:- start:97 stop:543 length:447 start_codon:yes stop_codon:yes gene_type:complete